MDLLQTLRNSSMVTEQDKIPVLTDQYGNDKIGDTLDVTPISMDVPVKADVEVPDMNVEKDLEYARENVYHLIERGRDALDGILDLASQSQHPRAFEVAGQLIKTISDTNNDLVKIHKSAKDLMSDPEVNGKVTNNNLFVGSTSELTRLLGGNARDILKAKKDKGA